MMPPLVHKLSALNAGQKRIRKIKVYLLTLLLSVSSGFVWAEEDLNLTLPQNRYIRQNPNIETLSFWRIGVSLEVSGAVEPETARYAVAKVETLSEYASLQMEMPGRPEIWLLPKESISGLANYAIVFGDFPPELAGEGRQIFGDDVNISVRDVRPEVKEIFQRGVPFRGPGCFADWNADSNNIVNAFVLLVDSSLPSHRQKQCIDFMVPSSFGVYPVVSRYEFVDKSGRAFFDAEKFNDQSEVILLLKLSAYCRLELGDKSLGCPSRLISQIHRSHSNLLK